MGKVRSFLVKSVIPAAMVIVFVCAIAVSGKENQPPEKDEMHHSVAITIDTLNNLGQLERPAVEFLHDRHTAALEKMQKDCTVCHLAENDRLSLKFQRLKDDSKQQVMDIYHSRCIECHKQMASSGEKAGPVSCRDCHKEKPSESAVFAPMGFDKSLHFRHTRAAQDKCERCHHDYDNTARKLFYAKGKEGSCRYCHKEITEENRISDRQASHIACIDCHRKTVATGKKAGPVHCSGCHDPEKRNMIEKVKDVPRMKRNQPDTVLIKTGKDAVQPEYRMNFTPFDHKAHEKYNDTCRVCHHADLGACNTCHTIAGSKEGGGITLTQAMHQAESGESCKGCHALRKEDRNCAGCHHFVDQTKPDELSCQKCHMAPVLPSTQSASKNDDSIAARALLDSRTAVTASLPDALLKAIPRNVVLKTLSNQYEPVDFPHRKIVQALMQHIGDNKLAGMFHLNPMTSCQGCHHNSPAADKPPKCQSCHNKPFNMDNPQAPGLMGAYHQQCMGCHKAMGIEKPMGCTECHKEKKS